MSGSYHNGIRDLNILPTADDPDADAFSPDDLAIFTNTRFFDFDMGPETKQGSARAVSQQEEDAEGDPLADGELIDPNLKGGNMDFLNGRLPRDKISFFFSVKIVLAAGEKKASLALFLFFSLYTIFSFPVFQWTGVTTV